MVKMFEDQKITAEELLRRADKIIEEKGWNEKYGSKDSKK